VPPGHGRVSPVKATLRWQGTRDLDLAAYWRQGEERGLVYYDQVGNRDAPPYIQLLGDDDGRGGENREELLITRVQGTIWLLCWDSARLDAAEAGPLEAELTFEGETVAVVGTGNLAVLGVIRDGLFTARPQVHTITGLEHIDTLEALLS